MVVHVLEPDTLSIDTIPAQVVTIGKIDQYQTAVKYTGTGTVTYSIVWSPTFITINPSTGVISVNATTDSDKGVYDITIKATDGIVSSSTPVSIQVLEPDTLSINPITEQSLTRNETYQYQTTVKYTGSGTLKYILISAPSFLSINATTGLITADTADLLTSNTHQIKVSVTDGIVSATTPVEYEVVLSPTLEKCLAGTITPVTTGPLYALEGSLFSDVLYVQGNGKWKPQEISFKIEDKNKNPLEGCYIYVRPQPSNAYPKLQTATSIYFPINSVSDKNGLVSGYWESKYGQSGLLLVSLISNPTNTIELQGTISDEAFANTAPSTYVWFHGDAWTEYNVDLTVLYSAAPTYYQMGWWYGAYFGLQESSNAKNFIFSVWKSKDGLPILLEGYDSTCDTPKNSPEGTFVRCTGLYPWEYGKTYQFKLTAVHNEPGYIDYSLQVNEKGSTEITKIAVIRQPQPADYYPGTPTPFIEQWTTPELSCLAIQKRIAVYSNASIIKPNETTPTPVTSANFYRPYSASAGRGSICFNYLYGNIDSVPILLPNGQSIKEGLGITDGFIGGVGGNVVSYPADNNVAKTVSGNIPLKASYFVISDLNDFEKINSQKDYLPRILFVNRNVQLNIDSSNYIKEINLPSAANHLNLINIVNGDANSITVKYDNDKSIVINGKSSKSFSYNDGGWSPF
jgi:hypothetical protein